MGDRDSLGGTWAYEVARAPDLLPLNVPERSRTLTGDIEDALNSMRGGADVRFVKMGMRWCDHRSFGTPGVARSLAGAVGAVGNAELDPAFSKGCGKARASQRGFP